MADDNSTTNGNGLRVNPLLLSIVAIAAASGGYALNTTINPVADRVAHLGDDQDDMKQVDREHESRISRLEAVLDIITRDVRLVTENER